MIEALLIGAAGWRIASLFVYEAGPYRMFERLRNHFAPPGPVEGQMGILLTCVWCCSVWTTALCALIWIFVSEWVIIALAAMSVALLIEMAINHKELVK